MNRTRVASVLPWIVAVLVGASVGAAVQAQAQENEQLYPGTFCFSRYDETDAVYDGNRYVSFGLPVLPTMAWAMCPLRSTSDFTPQTIHSGSVVVRVGGTALMALCRSQSESNTVYDCGAASGRGGTTSTFADLALPPPTAGTTTSTSTWFVFAQLSHGASIARYCARRAGASATMCPAP